jgi:hypothetical protein
VAPGWAEGLKQLKLSFSPEGVGIIAGDFLPR